MTTNEKPLTLADLKAQREAKQQTTRDAEELERRRAAASAAAGESLNDQVLASEELDFAVHDDLEDREEAEAAPDVSHDPRLTPDVLLQQIQARRALVEAEGPALAAVAAAVVARFATVLERNHGWTREESIRAAIRVGASLI